MTEFNLSNAVTLFCPQSSSINSLWAVYVAATFATASYGLSQQDLHAGVVLAISLGFSVFALCHWSLVMQALRINRTLGSEINAHLEQNKNAAFAASLRCLTRSANPYWISLSAHVIIDVCVLAALWNRVGWSLH
ncbi:hypothetical protein [Methylopila sp. M107]|uniref:hypothetical protein n=1 Tax=Methylopila sp. M107 TaxID=1101190 RepID=UPI0012DF8DA6|nr:hypothetical protein [Methylopila sp. M107]